MAKVTSLGRSGLGPKDRMPIFLKVITQDGPTPEEAGHNKHRSPYLNRISLRFHKVSRNLYLQKGD
jgi:hypothetical protein